VYAKNPDSEKTPPRKPKQPKRTRSSSDTLRVYGGALLLTVLAFFVTFQFVEPAPPRSLTIATGPADGAYYRFALDYRDKLAEHGITLNVRVTSGSLENLNLLSSTDEAVQLAFVQSGTADAYQQQPLQGLASVYLEPVWVFTREPVDNGQLQALRGKRVAIGAEESGTHAVAQQLLLDNALEATVVTHNIGGSEAVSAFDQGLVDAIVAVGSYLSQTLQTLLHHPDTHLMSFSRAQAYARRHAYLSNVQLPQGAIDLARNIPAADVALIAPAATLVARESLHPALSDLIMQISATLFSPATLLSAEGQFPSADFLDFPLSPEAARYYKSGPPFLQRFLPFWAATLVDRLKVLLLPLIALLLPLSKILPPTYRWTVRKKIFHWYEELQLVDQSATEIPSEENLEHCLANLDKIEREVKAIEVPLGYAHELYILRQHIDLLARQIGLREQVLENQRLQRAGDSQHHR